MRPPLASVVVATRYRIQLLGRCLAALSSLDHDDYEVIVVDNTAGDAEVEQLARDAGFRYVQEPQVGLSRARNTGAGAARGNIVAFLDDDAIPDPDWLTHHTRALEDTTLGATTGRVLPIASDQATAGPLGGADQFDLGSVPFRLDRSNPAWFEISNFGGIGIGPNMAFRRILFERGFEFRTSLGPGARVAGEEHYAFFTIIRAGHAIEYVPAAVVRHDFATTQGELADRRRRILEGGAGYITMLLAEEPEFRRATLRYVVEALRGVRRPWRHSPPEPRSGSRSALLRAAIRGPLLYVQTRRTGRRT